MSDNNKSYRIKTNVGEDNVLNVSLTQDYNVLEVLSLKLDADNMYKYHTADYGCVAGRVLANGNFGIPNAKISIFIAVEDADAEDDIISYLYPYKSTRSKNRDKIRYNLLTEEQINDCHRAVGTFPTKRTVLDDNNVLEVYDKYYKFTTRSNEAGDFMIFGVPVGNQTIHVDIDLSDIGILSQTPRDMVYKGYSITQFENANMFKKSNELDNLAQIISQNQNVYVYPFWGEDTEGDIAISRKDIDIQYEFTPTCIFMGSMITDERSSGISKRCIPSERMGKMDRLTTGKGTIEMIRKKANGEVEEVVIQGNELIDGNGVWCYQIPMNLDYVKTDEYGNIVPTDDPTKGIPTRTKVRFRMSLTEFETENEYSHISKVLIPNNPKYYDSTERGDNKGAIVDYVFGSETDESSFKDLLWNNVYTVKSYVPRIQMLNLDKNKRFSGFKAVNVNNGNNPIPYNNMRVDLTFMFTLQCAVFKILLWVIKVLNNIFSALAGMGPSCKINIGEEVIGHGGKCVYLGDGYCPQLEGWYFAPGCSNEGLVSNTLSEIRGNDSDSEDKKSADYRNKDSDNGKTCLARNIEYFIQCAELNFAMEYDVIQFDFYNDWINGMIYMPRWFADIRPKRSFLFGLVNIPARINACAENAYHAIFSRRYVQQCALEYGVDENGNYTKVETPKGCKNDNKQKCHKSKGRKWRKILAGSKNGGGLVHDELTMQNKYAYYFRPCEWVDNNNDYGTKCNLFATDIILIGSLKENNAQGIPQTFKKLVSSSYQMPDALASTNMGVDGFLYGIDDGATCRGKALSEGDTVEQMPNDFSGVEIWTGEKDFNETNPYDEGEYAITEASGIDWGYMGPGQEWTDRNGKKIRENDLENLYFPGGHFLGISCFNSEVNIKSCVNLSRICEMGTLISQRQAIINKKDENNYEYSYLIPTGLIAGDEVNDYGFKNEFATLNYNGLATKINPETMLCEYDFETINPINFNGEIAALVNNKDYNNENGTYENSAVSTTKVYKRTLEENSKEYYKFRFNLHEGDNPKDKYLNVNGSKVSLPQYENSFYFYFGLKNGNTALDRFYEEFFAECPALKEYSAKVNVAVTPSEFCRDSGAVTIITKNIEEPKYKLYKEGEAITPTPVAMQSESVVVQNLEGDKNYSVEVYGENISAISKSFMIPRIVPDTLLGLSCEFIPYTEERDDYDTCDNGSSRNKHGKIKFTSSVFTEDANIVAIAVFSKAFKADDGKPIAAILFKDGEWIDEVGRNYAGISYYNDESISSESGNFRLYRHIGQGREISGVNGEMPVWSGNKKYTVAAYYKCTDSRIIREYISAEEIIEMPEEVDIIFGSNPYASYKHLIRPLLRNMSSDYHNMIKTEWFDIVLLGKVDTGSTASRRDKLYTYLHDNVFEGNDALLNDVKDTLAENLFYTNGQCDINTARGNIRYEVTYGTPPYTERLSGDGELLSEEGETSMLMVKSFNSEEDANRMGYDLSAYSFMLPTLDNPEYNSSAYFYNYRANKTKKNYTLSVRDMNTVLETITIPSIYRPRFFRAVYMSTDDGSGVSQKIEIAASNIAYILDRQPGDFGKHDYIRDNGLIRYIDNDGEMQNINVIHNSLNDTYYKGRLDGYSEDPNNIEKYYQTFEFTGELSRLIKSGRYSVEISEDGARKNLVKRTVFVNFIGDETGMYNPKVKYYCVSEEFYNKMKKLKLTNYKDGSIYITYADADDGTYYYWTTVMKELFAIMLNPINSVDIMSGNLDAVTSDYVIGIYDATLNACINSNTNIIESYMRLFFAFGEQSEEVFGKEAPRHDSTLSIIRFYSGERFKNYISVFGNN